MSEWQELPLGDVASIQTGPFGSQLHSSDYVKVGIPSIMPTNIGLRLDINTSNISFITEEDAERLDKYLIREGDIVYSRRGDVEKCAYISKKEDGWLCGTGCLRIRFKPDAISPKFCAYYLSSDEIKGWISGNAVGTTMPNLNSSILRRVPLIVPPLSEQKAIAQILSSLDDKIDLLHRQNKTLEAIAEILFRQWFIEEAQDDWEEVSLGSLGIVITGKTPSTKATEYWGENIDFVTPTDFRDYEKYAIKASRGLSIEGKRKSKKILIPAGSILTTCIGSDMGKVVISVKECITNQQINSLTVTSDLVSTEYVYQCLRSIYPLLRSIALGGTTMPIINKTDFSNIEVLVPPKEKLIAFDKISSSLNSRILYNTAQAHIAENLRHTLLPKLMSGEVRVTEDPETKSA
jgi:type I restriction enzyme, S subunit